MAGHYIELRPALAAAEQEELQAEDGQEPPQESALRRVNHPAAASGVRDDNQERQDHDSVAVTALAGRADQEAQHDRVQDSQVTSWGVDSSKRGPASRQVEEIVQRGGSVPVPQRTVDWAQAQGADSGDPAALVAEEDDPEERDAAGAQLSQASDPEACRVPDIPDANEQKGPDHHSEEWARLR